MPTSNDYQLASILKTVSVCAPHSVLDVGIGNGRYGFMLRQQLDTLHKPSSWVTRLEGVEIFPDYLTPVQRYVYDRIHIADALQILPSFPADSFDLAIMLDVIEHLNVESGLQVYNHLRGLATTVVLSTPRWWVPQPPVFDNPHEQHKTFWRPRDFVDSLHYTVDTQLIIMTTKNEDLHKKLLNFVAHQRLLQWAPPAFLAFRHRSHGRGD